MDQARKQDRRIVRTRRALSEALIDLALERGHDNFSIKELTERADIGYATFYRHFKSMDELLMHVVKSTLEDLKRVIAEADSPRAEAGAMYRHVSNFPRNYRLYMSLPETNEARQMVRDEMAKLLLDRYIPREGSRVPLEVAVNHIIQSAFELTRWYLNNLDDYTPEQVTAIYADLISRETTAVSFVQRDEWLQRFPARQREP